MSLSIAIVALGAVTAGFVQGLSGFAFGLVAMSFWAWVIDPKLAAVLAVAGAFTGQVVGAFSVRRRFDRGALVPFLLGGLAGIPIGVALLPLWCTLRGYERDTQRAIVQNFNLAMLAVTLASYLLSGFVTREAWPLLTIVLPSMLVPAFLGTRLYLGIGEATFRRIVLMLLTASGLTLLGSALARWA